MLIFLSVWNARLTNKVITIVLICLILTLKLVAV